MTNICNKADQKVIALKVIHRANRQPILALTIRYPIGIQFWSALVLLMLDLILELGGQSEIIKIRVLDLTRYAGSKAAWWDWAGGEKNHYGMNFR